MKHILIILSLLSYNIFSQESLTLEKAIEYGISNNYDIKIIKNDAQIVKNSTNLGAAGLLPNIIISSGYNGSINNSSLKFNSFLETGGVFGSDIDASEAQSSNLTSSIGLNYTIFKGWSGIYTLQKFKKQNNIANENIRYNIESKIIEIVQQYYDLLNKENIYNTFSYSHDISLDRYKQASEKYDIGALSKLDFLNIEVNLNQDKVNKEEAKIMMNQSKLKLALLIGLEDTSFTLFHNFNFNENLNLDTLINLMKVNNSNIKIAELNYKICQDELKISKSAFSPKIDLFSSYTYNSRNSETSFISNQIDYGVVAGVNMEIPIFTGNIRSKAFQNAKINLQSKNYALENIRKTIETTLTSTYLSYVEGLKNLKLIKSNLTTIEKTAQLNKELYDLGQISNLEYREAKILLEQAKINYSSKLSETKIKEFIIYQLTGQLQSKK